MYKCNFCSSPLNDMFVDLGCQPASNSFLTAEQIKQPDNNYPLCAYVCAACFLVQVPEHKSAAQIFNENYHYMSSYSVDWLAHCKQYVDMIVTRLNLNPSSMVAEVGSNDGYLLQYFKEKKIPSFGIEPAKNIASIARAKGIDTIDTFLNADTARSLLAEGKGADLIIANNVMAHVPRLNDFIAGLKYLLKANGVITIEAPHLYQLIRQVQFDTIYQEHYSYLSFNVVVQMFKAHALKVFDVEEIPTHGGSLRIYASHENNANLRPSEAVKKLTEFERISGMQKLSYYKDFQRQVDRVKEEFLLFLKRARAEGKSVAAYGAAAKGNTFINYCGIKSDLINFVVDASPLKQGKFLPGSHIPIVKESQLSETKPDFVVILPWNIAAEIRRQISYITKWGAQFVIAIPKLEVLSD